MWFFYALAVPALYSITNFIDKFLLEKKVKDPLSITVLGAASSGVLGLGIFIFRGFPRLDFVQTSALLCAGILLVLYLIPVRSNFRVDFIFFIFK